MEMNLMGLWEKTCPLCSRLQSEVEMLREIFPVIPCDRMELQLHDLHCIFQMAKNKDAM